MTSTLREAAGAGAQLQGTSNGGAAAGGGAHSQAAESQNGGPGRGEGALPSQQAATGSTGDAENASSAVIMFCKTLTSSDSNGSGRVVIPKAAAEQHFPSIASHAGAPIDFLDTFGTVHTLLLRFWENKSSKIFLLEGTLAIQKAYGLSKGDSVVFSRASDGRLHVAGYKGRHIPLAAIAEGVNAATAGTGLAASAAPQLPGSYRAPDATVRKRRKMARPMRAPFGNVDLQCKVEAIQQAPSALKASSEERQDGIFRVVKGKGAHLEPGITEQPDGTWVAVLDLSGKKYQACFGSQEEARQAIITAGFNATQHSIEAFDAVKAEL